MTMPIIISAPESRHPKSRRTIGSILRQFMEKTIARRIARMTDARAKYKMQYLIRMSDLDMRKIAIVDRADLPFQR